MNISPGRRLSRKLHTYVARAGNFIEKTNAARIVESRRYSGLLWDCSHLSIRILVPTRNVSTNQRDKIREGLLMTFAKILSGSCDNKLGR
jgi:hypothetical protein